MDIDVTALKSLVREKNLSLDLLVETIEAALFPSFVKRASFEYRGQLRMQEASSLCLPPRPINEHWSHSADGACECRRTQVSEPAQATTKESAW